MFEPRLINYCCNVAIMLVPFVFSHLSLPLSLAYTYKKKQCTFMWSVSPWYFLIPCIFLQLYEDCLGFLISYQKKSFICNNHEPHNMINWNATKPTNTLNWILGCLNCLMLHLYNPLLEPRKLLSSTNTICTNVFPTKNELTQLNS